MRMSQSSPSPPSQCPPPLLPSYLAHRARELSFLSRGSPANLHTLLPPPFLMAPSPYHSPFSLLLVDAETPNCGLTTSALSPRPHLEKLRLCHLGAYCLKFGKLSSRELAQADSQWDILLITTKWRLGEDSHQTWKVFLTQLGTLQLHTGLLGKFSIPAWGCR